MGNVACCGDISDVVVPTFGADTDSSIPSCIEHSPTKTTQIKILSYNIFIRPPPVKTFHDDYKNERLAEFSKLINKYDIICLQELFQPLSSRRSKLIRAAHKAGLEYSSGCPKHEFFSSLVCDGGLLTLSRFPIIATQFKPFPRGLGADYFVQKGVLYTKIQIKDSTLHLFSTHTQAAYTTEAKYFITLMNQWRCFRQFMDEMLKKNEYKKDDFVMALGDFNVDGRNPISYDIKELEKLYPAIKDYPNLIKEGTFHEYDTLVSIISKDGKDDIEEVLFSQYGEHPTTYGDFYVDTNNRILPLENELTYEGGQTSNRRLDYMFKITPNIEGTPCNEEKVKSKLSVKEGSAKVRKFFVDGHNFTQLSDHYGVKVTLNFEGNLRRVLRSGSTLSDSPEGSEKELEEIEKMQEGSEKSDEDKDNLLKGIEIFEASPERVKLIIE